MKPLVLRFQITSIKRCRSRLIRCERGKLLPYGHQAVHLVEHVDTPREPAARVVPPLGVPPVGPDHAGPAIVGGCVVKVPEVWVVDKCVAARGQIDGPLGDGPGPAAVKDEGEGDARHGEEGRPPGQLGDLRFCLAQIHVLRHSKEK